MPSEAPEERRRAIPTPLAQCRYNIEVAGATRQARRAYPARGSRTTRVFLEPGHVKPVWAGHPWVYAQAIAHVEGSPAAGDVVEVRDRQSNFLGRGFWSAGSAIPVR